MVSQIFRDLGGEEARMRVGEPIKLSVHFSDDVGVLVTKARNCRSTRRVDILLAELSRMNTPCPVSACG